MCQGEQAREAYTFRTAEFRPDSRPPVKLAATERISTLEARGLEGWISIQRRHPPLSAHLLPHRAAHHHGQKHSSAHITVGHDHSPFTPQPRLNSFLLYTVAPVIPKAGAGRVLSQECLESAYGVNLEDEVGLGQDRLSQLQASRPRSVMGNSTVAPDVRDLLRACPIDSRGQVIFCYRVIKNMVVRRPPLSHSSRSNIPPHTRQTTPKTKGYQGLGSFSSSPKPLYTDSRRPLLDVRPRGRNQDKPLVLSLRAAARRFGFFPMPIIHEWIRDRPAMGESDPSHAGHLLWFWSLQFETTGNGYHLRLLNQGAPSPPNVVPPPPLPMPEYASPPPPEAACGSTHAPCADEPARVGTSGSQPALAGVINIPHDLVATDAPDAPPGRSYAAVAASLPPAPFTRASPRPLGPSPFPTGLRNAAAGYSSTASAGASAYDDLSGDPLTSIHNFAASASDDSYAEAAAEVFANWDDPTWDYSWLHNPDAYHAFQAAADFCFGYYDDSSDGDYDPFAESTRKKATPSATRRRLLHPFTTRQQQRSHVARKYNEKADELAKIASGRITIPPNVLSLDVRKPSIEIERPALISSEAPTAPVSSHDDPMDEDPPMGNLEPMDYDTGSETEVMEIDEAPATLDWRDPFLAWLDRGVLPSNQTEARRIARQAKAFVLLDGELHRRSASGILQRCIPILEGKELILDIHAGICGHHATPRTLVGNAFRQGFYWPTAIVDATEAVCTCEGCQFYARKTHLPAHVLQTIPITWPFAVWGLDLFSKWIEARPLEKIKSKQAVECFTDIVHRFRVPNSIITNNGTQFTGKKFLEFCDDYHIRVDWSAVAHPQTNGQVEHANGMILQGLKPRIFERLKKFGSKWIEELPSVIWSLRTTPSKATGFSPFFLVYGAEAVLPTDLEYGSPRLKAYQEQQNQCLREDTRDQVDEAREVALLHSARYQQSLRWYQAQRVRRRDFNKGDLVLRLRQDNRGRHKLTPPWEGPYIVAEVLKPGTYKLTNEDGEIFSNAWNIQQLRRSDLEARIGNITQGRFDVAPRNAQSPSGADKGPTLEPSKTCLESALRLPTIRHTLFPLRRLGTTIGLASVREEIIDKYLCKALTGAAAKRISQRRARESLAATAARRRKRRTRPGTLMALSPIAADGWARPSRKPNGRGSIRRAQRAWQPARRGVKNARRGVKNATTSTDVACRCLRQPRLKRRACSAPPGTRRPHLSGNATARFPALQIEQSQGPLFKRALISRPTNAEFEALKQPFSRLTMKPRSRDPIEAEHRALDPYRMGSSPA
nr:unnamed protein product [Digitaria exilis]